jgi:hypothetical protein
LQTTPTEGRPKSVRGPGVRRPPLSYLCHSPGGLWGGEDEARLSTRQPPHHPAAPAQSDRSLRFLPLSAGLAALYGEIPDDDEDDDEEYEEGEGAAAPSALGKRSRAKKAEGEAAGEEEEEEEEEDDDDDDDDDDDGTWLGG